MYFLPHAIETIQAQMPRRAVSMKTLSSGPGGSRTLVLHAYLIQDKTSLET